MIAAVNDFLDDLRGGRMTEAPIVRVEQGALQGRVTNSPSGKGFYSFQGIPYAKPPLGSLRFKAPQPPETWEGVRDATSEGNISAQVDPLINKGYAGDENCLFLNVYTPNIDGEFLPVMVFVHGGGFRFGSGGSALYGCDYLVEKDVVVVTLNYRCGALGFLSLNTPEVPGNAGLKDIVQAIRWVKQNIGNFGGNSGNITVFGESAGGVAASILAASPLTKTEISRVIIQSGTALNSWAFQRNPVENARKLAHLLGCDSGDVDDILEFLRATPVRDLVEAYEKLNPSDKFTEEGLIDFAPVVEKEFPGVESVLNEAFIHILTSGRFADIPVMIGTNGLEFPKERNTDDFQSYIPPELHVERNSEDSIAIANGIKRLYFNEKSPTAVESITEKIALISDVLFNIDTHRFVQYLVKTTNKPIYLYKFDYVGELNYVKKFLDTYGVNHAVHGDELGYLFKNDFEKTVEATTQDIYTRERMLKLWTNFAKTGNPTPEENHHITVTWLPITKDNMYCLNIGSELSLITNPDKDKMDFWDYLYTKHFRIWEHPKIVHETRTEDVQVSQDTTPVIGSDTEQETRTEDQVSMETTPVSVPNTVQETRTEEIRVFQDTTPVIVQETIIQTVTTVVDDLGTNVEVVEEVQEVVDNTKAIDEEEPKNNEAEAQEEVRTAPEVVETKVYEEKPQNGVKELAKEVFNGNIDRKPRPSNEIKMVQHSNGHPKDVIRANDPPEDDLPKNIGVNKFVNFFESLGGKK